MVFTKKSTTMFNNTVFNQPTIDDVKEIHEKTQRLYLAAKELRSAIRPSAVVRLMGISHQTLKNWDERGVSGEGALLAQKTIGCDANWLLDGGGSMTSSPWTPSDRSTKTLAAEPTNGDVLTLIPARSWPFKAITREDVMKLTEHQLGQVEGFMKHMIQTSTEDRKSTAV